MVPPYAVRCVAYMRGLCMLRLVCLSIRMTPTNIDSYVHASIFTNRIPEMFNVQSLVYRVRPYHN